MFIPLIPFSDGKLDSDVTSPDSVLTISVYDRSKAGEGFLGVKEIKPVLKDGVTVDNWFALSPRGEEHVTGEIWLQISYDALKVGLSGQIFARLARMLNRSCNIDDRARSTSRPRTLRS